MRGAASAASGVSHGSGRNNIFRFSNLGVCMKDVWTMITRASLLLCSVLMIGAFSALEAQTRDYDCTCPTEALGVTNVPICIGGVNYVVEVTRCQEFGDPPQLLGCHLQRVGSSESVHHNNQGVFCWRQTYAN